jgi:hypothetical protein
MAIAPQPNWLDDTAESGDLCNPKPGHTLPGCTVDALLEQGRVEEARAELERLVQEGIDSGPGIEVTPKFWEDIRSEVRRRAKARQ